MAKFELKFLDSSNSKTTVKCNVFNSRYIEIIIENNNECVEAIYLDKRTSIKFAKTLRTEINKITESEVNNGYR